MSNNSKRSGNVANKKKKLRSGNNKLVAAPTIYTEAMRDTFYIRTMGLLAKHFGYYKLRPLSRSIIATLTVRKRDVCAVLAPGYGKSICYQLPAVLNDGLVIVVAPLTFSVIEQVQRLYISGLKSCILENFQDYRSKINELINTKYNIVYISPQIITSRKSAALDALKNANIQLIAILEAHCVTPFSHDYRLLYRELSILKETFPTVPILALTSTPAPVVRTEIITSLKLKRPLVTYSGCHRANVYLQVNEKRNDHLTEDVLSAIAENDGPTLIYTLSRIHVMDFVTKLKGAGITSCAGYYVGQSVGYINETYQSFAANQIKILVTTSGGGLVVSKPDIRNVIHCHASKDIESYYQEIGRAGRDGLKAKCVLFYSQSDMDTHEILRNSSTMVEPGEVTSRRDRIANVLKDYALSKNCRWAYLLKHFDEAGELTSTLCNHCDNCKIRTLNVHPQATAKNPGGQSNKTTARPKENDLLEKLKAERLRLSSELNCLPYVIASDKALKKLSFKRPCTPIRIRKCEVEGFSNAIVDRFGNDFLKVIKQHINETRKADAVSNRIKKQKLKSKQRTQQKQKAK